MGGEKTSFLKVVQRKKENSKKCDIDIKNSILYNN